VIDPPELTWIVTPGFATATLCETAAVTTIVSPTAAVATHVSYVAWFVALQVAADAGPLVANIDAVAISAAVRTVIFVFPTGRTSAAVRIANIINPPRSPHDFTLLN
jgi:hypothetical protein